LDQAKLSSIKQSNRDRASFWLPEPLPACHGKNRILDKHGAIEPGYRSLNNLPTLELIVSCW